MKKTNYLYLKNYTQNNCYMGTYLKRFQTQSEYSTYITSENAILPNVSLVEEGGRAMFKPDLFNGFEYVDLGLPSGTLWAKCNIGASDETQPGYYFQWGDHDNMTSTDLNCDWENYRFAEEMQYMEKGAEQYYITKYKESDGLTCLLPQDDTATVLMGRNWHMPDREAFNELSDYTTGEIVNQNGYNGLGLTSTINGNQLFFPFAGYRSYYALNDSGTIAYCWSREVESDYYAYYGGLNNNYFNKAGTSVGLGISDLTRISAIPVRGVVGPRMTGK